MRIDWAKVRLRQGAALATLPLLREQRVQVASFVLENGKLALDKNIAVTYKGKTTPVPDMAGSACPDLVYPNYQDWGFVKVVLDKRSFAAAGRHLRAVDDPLLRAMLWQSLWDGVRDGQYPLDAFLGTVLANLGGEPDYSLLGNVLGKVSESVDYLDSMQVSAAYRARTGAALRQMAWAGMMAHKDDSNFVRRWYGLYQDVASDQTGLDSLASILAGTTVIEGWPLSQDARWSIIGRLNRYGYPGSAALIETELARDKSDSGQAAALRATVLRPEPKVKAEWLAKIEDLKTALPFSRIRVAMGSLYPAGQSALAEATAAQRLDGLAAIDQAASPVYMRAYAGSMIPANCTPASVARLEKAVGRFRNLSAGTGRALRDTLEQDRRCLTIRKAMTVR